MDNLKALFSTNKIGYKLYELKFIQHVVVAHTIAST